MSMPVNPFGRYAALLSFHGNSMEAAKLRVSWP
jgi:hypothetical protein